MAAFKELGPRKANDGTVERVILLTDGQADTGNETYGLIKKAMKDVREGISMSCFGYGTDYNEVLLEQLSKDHNGGNYFVDSVGMLSGAFAQELGSLLTCFATGLKLLAAPSVVGELSVASCLNDLPTTDTEVAGRKWFTVDAGDLFYGEKKKLFLRLKCSAKGEPVIDSRPIDINVVYKELGAGAMSEVKHALTPAISFLGDDEVDLKPDQEVGEQVLVLDAARNQIEAKDLADQGEWQLAKEICDKMIENLEKYDTAYTRSYAAVMKESSSGFANGYQRGGLGAKSASTASYTVLRGGRGMSGGLATASMADFSSMAYCSNDLTKGLVDTFTDKKDDKDKKGKKDTK